MRRLGRVPVLAAAAKGKPGTGIQIISSGRACSSTRFRLIHPVSSCHYFAHASAFASIVAPSEIARSIIRLRY